MDDGEDEVNSGMDYHFGERIQSKSKELYQRNALGNIASQLFPSYGEFFAVPLAANHEYFELFSVFVKQDKDTFEYIGRLRKNGGILTEKTTDLLHSLRPHLHSSSKRNVNRYLIAQKPPFTGEVSEFSMEELTGRPEGKFFSWIDLGETQIEYVDPVKLTARINKLRVDQESPQLCGKTCIYVVYKVWYTDRLHYYPSKEYTSCAWFGNDKPSLDNQIKLCIKSMDRCCINLDTRDARAFSVCLIPLSADGTLGTPSYNVKLVTTNPFRTAFNESSFCAQELDFEFITWLTSQVRGMRTKRFWQPALRKLFSLPNPDERQAALKFLLETMKKFQTENEHEIQLLDFSAIIPNPPPCLISIPSILASFLRGAGIILTAPQQADDGDVYEEQIVFQPENCQENLRILEALFTVLVKGVITEQQGKSVSQLLATEVVSLQELFFTQMGCICAPWKTLDPREKPLSELWKKPSRTRSYLESLGLQEILHENQVVVICPENCQLLNILSLFYGSID